MNIKKWVIILIAQIRALFSKHDKPVKTYSSDLPEKEKSKPKVKSVTTVPTKKGYHKGCFGKQGI